MKDKEIVLLGCGDVGPLQPPMEKYSTFVRATLHEADIRFANCERLYTEKGSHQNNGHAYNRLPPHMASLFTDCGFDVLSLAANHAMDMGSEAMLDTMANLQALGIQTCGAGRTLAEARRPAIFERKGVKVAFLAYCSILKEGHAATADKPGVAPLRVHTYYEPVDAQPGAAAVPVTIPHKGDLAALVEDVRAAKRSADVVVVSMHWGVHFVPRVIADYQTTCAQAAFAAGADIIFGHHAHLPKAVAMLDGKACFHSLGNFIMSSPPFTPEKAREFCDRYGVELDPRYPLMRYGRNSHRSLIAKAHLTRQGIDKVSFLPVLIDESLRPEPIPGRDPRFAEAASFIESLSTGFGASFRTDGDEVVVEPAGDEA